MSNGNIRPLRTSDYVEGWGQRRLGLVTQSGADSWQAWLIGGKHLGEFIDEGCARMAVRRAYAETQP